MFLQTQVNQHFGGFYLNFHHISSEQWWESDGKLHYYTNQHESQLRGLLETKWRNVPFAAYSPVHPRPSDVVCTRVVTNGARLAAEIRGIYGRKVNAYIKACLGGGDTFITQSFIFSLSWEQLQRNSQFVSAVHLTVKERHLLASWMHQKLNLLYLETWEIDGTAPILRKGTAVARFLK